MTESDPRDEPDEGQLVPVGWYRDPDDPTKERYWSGKWSKQTRMAGTSGEPAPTLPSRAEFAQTDDDSADGSRQRRRRIAMILTVFAVFIVVVGGVVAWLALRDDHVDHPTARDDALDNLVYTFVSPRVPCCSTFRNEGTANFTVEGNWRVDWRINGEGEPCQVYGRIVDTKAHRFTKFPPFGPKATGSKEYAKPGTYSIALEYRCPEGSVAMAEVRVFSSSA